MPSTSKSVLSTLTAIFSALKPGMRILKPSSRLSTSTPRGPASAAMRSRSTSTSRPVCESPNGRIATGERQSDGVDMCEWLSDVRAADRLRASLLPPVSNASAVRMTATLASKMRAVGSGMI
jgi:hypothetical protein